MGLDGWWACAWLDKLPWDFSPATLARFKPGAYVPDQDTWELYYLPDDRKVVFDLEPMRQADEQALHGHAEMAGVGAGAGG